MSNFRSVFIEKVCDHVDNMSDLKRKLDYYEETFERIMSDNGYLAYYQCSFCSTYRTCSMYSSHIEQCNTCDKKMCTDSRFHEQKLLQCQDCEVWICVDCVDKIYRDNSEIEYLCDSCVDYYPD